MNLSFFQEGEPRNPSEKYWSWNDTEPGHCTHLIKLGGCRKGDPSDGGDDTQLTTESTGAAGQ